jgi:hypothetical protein
MRGNGSGPVLKPPPTITPYKKNFPKQNYPIVTIPPTIV